MALLLALVSMLMLLSADWVTLASSRACLVSHVVHHFSRLALKARGVFLVTGCACVLAFFVSLPLFLGVCGVTVLVADSRWGLHVDDSDHKTSVCSPHCGSPLYPVLSVGIFSRLLCLEC
jgi:hypothetical protein